MGLLISSQVRAGVVAEIPLEYSSGYLWLKVQPAGQRETLNFILDSGAASSVLDLTAARRLDLSLGSRVPVQGVHSRMTAHRIERFNAQAGSITLPKSLLALDLSMVSRTCDRPIDGLLGADFFRERIVQIDFAAGKLRILDRAPMSECCAALPMKQRNGTFCVPVGVAGNPSRWMRVDTGCDSALEWIANGAADQRRSGTSIGLTNIRSRSLVAEVQLGSLTLPGVKTGLHAQQMFPGEAGLLGNALLARFCVTIDAPGSRLLLASK
jgi:hypothetical protein